MKSMNCVLITFLVLLNLSTASITGDDLQGEFQALSGPSYCPLKIKHESVTKLDRMRYYIYYENILHDNQVCSGDDFLTLMFRDGTSTAHSTLRTLSGENSFLLNELVRDSTKNKGDMILEELSNQGLPFYFGHSLNSQKCGKVTMPQNTYFFFFEPKSALALPGVSLHPGKKYMIMQGKNESKPCVYTNKILPTYP